MNVATPSRRRYGRRIALCGAMLFALTSASAALGGSYHRASRAEVRWMLAQVRWSRPLQTTLAREVLSLTPRGVTSLARKCSANLESVGAPPTARLTSTYSLLRTACSQLRRGATDVEFVVKAIGDFSYARLTMPPGESAAALPVGQPSSKRSVQVPRWSVAMTRLLKRRTIVRCWTAADWRLLTGEEHVINGGSTTTLAGGEPEQHVYRINLGPSDCAGLLAPLQRKPIASGVVQAYADLAALTLPSKLTPPQYCATQSRVIQVAKAIGLDSSAANQIETAVKAYLQENGVCSGHG